MIKVIIKEPMSTPHLPEDLIEILDIEDEDDFWGDEDLREAADRQKYMQREQKHELED